MLHERDDRRAIAERVAGEKPLPEEVLNRILQQTDGIPLFIEELTKTVLEAGILQEEADRYVLNGSRTFITNSQHANLVIVVAKTDPTAGAKGTYVKKVSLSSSQGVGVKVDASSVGIAGTG